MFGPMIRHAVGKVKEWYDHKYWKTHPCVIWGPCGTGKTLLCTLLAKQHHATFVTYEDDTDVLDKVKGWLQSSSRRETGVLAFADNVPQAPGGSWLLLDDIDSLEGQCRQNVIALLKRRKTCPGPILITCNNIYDKALTAVKNMPLTVQLHPHAPDNLKSLLRSVNPALSFSQLDELAALACGDARRCIVSAKLWMGAATTTDKTSRKVVDSVVNWREQGIANVKLYHSPFAAAESLVQAPEIYSRALDGQEFMVQTLLYQNYPCFARSVEQLSRIADEWSEFDLFDSLHELPEHTSTRLTYVIPLACRSSTPVRLKKLNPKYMRQTFDRKKISLDWHCLQKY